MNIANKLTILRMILVPFFVLFMLLTHIPLSYLWSLLIFSVASYTDYLDGKIARERNMVTNFGKFLDPIADKILVLSAMVCMIPSGLCSPVVVIIVLSREFIVSSLRLVASSQNVIIAAGKSGKLKTASQMISIIAVLALCTLRQFTSIELPISLISNILMWITAVLAVYSGAEYLWKNRKLIEIE